jgi:hypothetical protein
LTAVDTQDFGSGAYAVAWSPDGRYVVVAGNNDPNDVVVYEFDGLSLTPVPSCTLNYGTAAYAVAWSPDGYSIAVGGDHSPTVSVYWFNGSSLTTNTNMQKTSPATPVKSVAWSVDGQTLVVCGATGTTKTVVGYRYNGTSLMSGFSNNVTVAAGSDVRACVSPDGRYIAAGGYDGSNNLVLNVYDVFGGTVVSYSGVNRDLLITNLAWDASGSYVALIGSSSVTGRGLVVCPVVYTNNTTAQATLNGIVLGSDLSVNAIEGTRLAINGNFSGDLENVTGFASIVHQPQSGKLKLQKDLNLGVDLHPLFNSLNSVESNGKSIILTDELVINPERVIHFADDAIIDGRGNALLVGDGTRLLVDNDVTVTLKNMSIVGGESGPEDAPLQCLTDSSVIALNNATFSPRNDFYFNRGSLYVHNNVNIDGNSNFIYRSIRPSFIAPNAQLTIQPGVTFDFQPTMTAYPKRYPEPKDLFVMQDATAKMILDNSSLQATGTGLRITRGAIQAQGNVVLRSYTPAVPDQIVNETMTRPTLSGYMYADWHPNGSYVAVGFYGLDPEYAPSLRVYEVFDNKIIQEWTTTPYEAADNTYNIWIGSVSWSYDGRFLAVGADENYDESRHGIYIYEFDGVALTFRSALYYQASGGTYAYPVITWSPTDYFFAAGTIETAFTYNCLKLFSFNPSTYQATEIWGGYPFSPTNFIQIGSLAWASDGNTLAVGTSSNYYDDADLYGAAKILNFDGLSLTETCSCYYYNYSSNIYALSWRSEIAGEQYLSVGSQIYSLIPGGIRTYKYTGAALDEVVTSRIDDYGSCNSLDWSIDGQYLAASLSSDNNLPSLYTFNFSGSYPTQTLVSHYGGQKRFLSGDDSMVTQWSPDGTYLATGPGDSSISTFIIYRFDGQSLDTPANIQKHFPEGAGCLDWHPTGNYVAVGPSQWQYGNTRFVVYAFDGTTLTTNSDLTKKWSQVYSVDWSADGRYLLVCGKTNFSYGPNGGATIVIYDFDGLSLRECVRENISFTTYHSSLLFPSATWSADDRYVAGMFSVYEFDGVSLRSRATLPNGEYFNRKVSWTTDNQFVATSFGRVYKFDGSSLTTNGNLVPPIGPSIRARLQWHPSNRYLAVGGDGSLYVYEFDGIALRYNAALHIPSIGQIESVAWSADGRYLFIGGLFYYQAKPSVQTYAFDGVHLTEMDHVSFDMTVDAVVEGLAVSPNGHFIAMSCQQSYPGFEEFMVLPLTWTDTTFSPAAQNGITFGNSALGPTYNANLDLLPNAQVDVRGPLVFDNA